MIKLCGESAEHPIWVAVQYSEVSGNIAFKLLILRDLKTVYYPIGWVKLSGAYFDAKVGQFSMQINNGVSKSFD